jgi:PilZ domain
VSLQCGVKALRRNSGGFFEGQSMWNERRKSTREIVNRPARFQEHEIAKVRRCTIRDISDSGVRLVVPDGLWSSQFTLFDGAPVRCRVIWRLGELVGARFEKDAGQGERASDETN